MHTIVDRAGIAAELQSWAGAHAEVWMSHAPSGRLALRITREDEADALFVLALGCAYIRGPFDWAEAGVHVRWTPAVDAASPCEVLDESAGFLLRCESVTLLRAPATLAPTSFDALRAEYVADAAAGGEAVPHRPSRPGYFLRLGPRAFENAEVACAGRHVADVVTAVSELAPSLLWYAADVEGIGPPLLASRRPTPVLIGDAGTLAAAAREVTQFSWGVFVGVPGDGTSPSFRDGGLWTEDEENADLGDAVVEIRVFDTSYVSVATNDDAIAELIALRFVDA